MKLAISRMGEWIHISFLRLNLQAHIKRQVKGVRRQQHGKNRKFI